MLVSVKVKWGFKTNKAGGPAQPHKDRLTKLAKRLDALAVKDEDIMQQARKIACLRRQAAVELYRICAAFVGEVNQLLAKIELEIDPPEYSAENFQDTGINLFQINARGRILQIRFEATAELTSTEDFRLPYILAGSIRCFNQQLLEKDLIEEQSLFYTLEKSRNLWRFFDARTYRSGPFNTDYLTGLMEQLV